MKTVISSTLIGIGLSLIASSWTASAANTDYVVTPDPTGTGLDVWTVSAGKVQRVPGSPFALNPFESAPEPELPFDLAISGQTLYTVYADGGDAGLASFSLQNGVPTLISTAGGIHGFGCGMYGNPPMDIGSRFIIVAEVPGPGGCQGSGLSIYQNSNGSLTSLGYYPIGIPDGPQLGMTRPTSVRTDAGDLTAYVSYSSTNPQSAGLWTAAAGSAAIASMSVGNGVDGMTTGSFSYKVTTSGCVQTATGSLAESDDGTGTGTDQVTGMGSYQQSGIHCSSASSNSATFTGSVSGQQFTLTTSSSAGGGTLNWQKVVSAAIPQSLFGNCGSRQCVAIYDISGVPNTPPKLLQTLPGGYTRGISPSLP